ncbi:hypothetical protein TDB9533_04487 [Thalassocella blandensis]|nr:hypothetical protein TDB9533_04487 [Thalassocella blandensis]
MELHIQKCQQCGSHHQRNILVRSEEQKVFVQCRDCKSLVARYILASGGYYHEGKDFESFLRSIERDQGTTSGRDLQTLFEEVQQSVAQEFEDTIKKAGERYGEQLP